MVESINHLPVKEQAEKLADDMSAVWNEYDRLKTNDIVRQYFIEEDIPVISVTSVESLLKQLKTNNSTPIDDIPPKIMKDFAAHISIPLTKLINSSIREGIYMARHFLRQNCDSCAEIFSTENYRRPKRYHRAINIQQ